MYTVRYNEERTHVLCRHCEDPIKRGSDYAVLLYLKEDSVDRKNPIGPYCPTCMPKVKLCNNCNEPNLGD